MTESKPQWAAEREVDLDLARRLIAGQFESVAARSIQQLGEGWDNRAFLVDGTWVFRFPRREVAAELIATESRVLPTIAGALPVPIPCPVWIGRPAEGYPWPFHGYRHLRGRSSCHLLVSDAVTEALVAPLAAFLRRLHSLPTGTLDAPFDTWRRTDIPHRQEQSRDRLRRHGAMIPSREALTAIIEDASSIALEDPPRLVHGDLYSRHLLAHHGQLTGVIDWGDLHVGQPALDLSIAFSFVPPGLRRLFWREYGEVSPAERSMARFRAAYHTLTLLDSALDRGDQDLVASALASIRNLV